MEAKSFISDKEIQDQVKKMIAEEKEIVIFETGKRVKSALVLKNTVAYKEYIDHLLQHDVTVDGKLYTIVYGVK